MLLGPVELHQHPPASRHPIPQPRTIESLAGQRFCLAAGGSSAAAFAFARVLASKTHGSRRERAKEGGKEMAAMVGARRALLAARYSPRGAIGASAAPVPPYRLADSPPRYCVLPRCLVEPALLFLLASLSVSSVA